MRTTLTLEDDVAALLTRAQKSRKTSFKRLINEALRRGLQAMNTLGPKKKKVYTRTYNVGKVLVPNLDNISEVLAPAEGEDYK
jgi:hypothetical protein